jgi:copper(I)-binding protein
MAGGANRIGKTGLIHAAYVRRSSQGEKSRGFFFCRKSRKKTLMKWTSVIQNSRPECRKSFLRRFFSKKRLLCLALLGLSPAWAFAATPSLTVQQPWMRYLLPSLPAAGYMVLQNAGDSAAVLTGAASPACGMLMLHKSQDDSGMATMMDVETSPIPAHGSVSFAPGGYHLMCMQPRMKIGDKVPVTLSFQDGASLATVMPVYGAQTAP